MPTIKTLVRNFGYCPLNAERELTLELSKTGQHD